MKSMTGFGLGKNQTLHSSIEVAVRAVNGRFLETRFHLPREFFQFESELKGILQEAFSRGTLDIFVTRKTKPNSNTHEILVNKSLAKQYLAAYKTLAKELKLPTKLSLESFARLPDVLHSEEKTEVLGEEQKSLFVAMREAVKNVDGERSREGKSLLADMLKVVGELDLLVAQIQDLREEANQTLEQRFTQKINKRLSEMTMDPGRLSQEIIIQLEKSDINEELARLREHVKNYHTLLTAKEPVGKKLDFYTQELLREVNTIGAKSSLSKLTQIVVQAKTLVERLREQVQNVE